MLLEDIFESSIPLLVVQDFEFNLIVLRATIPSTTSLRDYNDQQTLRAGAFLSPPKPNLSWRNVAVDMSSATEDTARIAVIWQSHDGGSEPYEL